MSAIFTIWYVMLCVFDAQEEEHRRLIEEKEAEVRRLAEEAELARLEAEREAEMEAKEKRDDQTQDAFAVISDLDNALKAFQGALGLSDVRIAFNILLCHINIYMYYMVL